MVCIDLCITYFECFVLAHSLNLIYAGHMLELCMSKNHLYYEVTHFNYFHVAHSYLYVDSYSEIKNEYNGIEKFC
jgi:hypothetical protein